MKSKKALITINPPKLFIMENIEVEKSKSFSITRTIEYILNAVVIKPIVRKTTGNLMAIHVDTIEVITESYRRSIGLNK